MMYHQMNYTAKKKAMLKKIKQIILILTILVIVFTVMIVIVIDRRLRDIRKR